MTAKSSKRQILKNVLTFPGLPNEEIAEFISIFRVLTVSLASFALVVFVITNGILEFHPIVLIQSPLALFLIGIHTPWVPINPKTLLTIDGLFFMTWALISHSGAPMGFSVGYYVAMAGLGCSYVALGSRKTAILLTAYLIATTAIGTTIREVPVLRLAVNAVSFAVLTLWLMTLMYGLAIALQRRDEVIALQGELAERSQRQNRMFGIIAHELRTPAAAARMLADQPDLSSNRRDLQSVTEHLLSVIDDMRVAVNPEAGFELNEGVFDALDLLNDIERQVTPLLSDGEFTLHVQSNFSPSKVLRGDAYRIRAIATNLLRNAYHHSGGSEIWLRVGTEEAQEERAKLWIEIEDNGKGIREADLATLMQPFERGESEAPGAGLGLHIVNTWSERLGGSLTHFAGATGGAGFRLEVTLPVCAEVEIREPKYLEHAQDILRGRKILLAEDDWLNSRLISNMLKREFDVELTLAREGKEAFELAKTHAFDLVISDFHMPKMSGFELTVELREMGYQGPIIGLTAATLGAEANLMLEAGAEEVLGKPMDVETFSRVIVGLEENGSF